MEQSEVRILGIDGGGTSTVCLLADAAGRVLARAEAPPSNHRKSDFESVRAAIRTGINSLARQTGLSYGEELNLSAVCAGLAGADTEGDIAQLLEVVREVVDASVVRVVNDGEIALEGALDGEPGVLVISGTGSIVWARSEEGRRVRVGGWDYLLSDEGSGYHIGLRMLRAIAAAHDRRTPPTVLSEEVYRAFSIDGFDEMLNVIYEEKLTPQAIASLAPIADRAAEAGDAIAAELLEETARELAELAEAAARRAALVEVDSFPLVPMGGTLLAGGYFSKRFRERVSERLPNAVLTEARLSPAEGALILAMRALKRSASSVPHRPA